MRYRDYCRLWSEFQAAGNSYRRLYDFRSPPVFGDQSYAGDAATNNGRIIIDWGAYYSNRRAAFGEIGISRLVALIGNRPNITKANFVLKPVSDITTTFTVALARPIRPVEYDSTLNSRYRTSSELWEGDAYAPWPGGDVLAVSGQTKNPYTPFAQETFTGGVLRGNPGEATMVFDITEELKWCLLRNTPFRFFGYQPQGTEVQTNAEFHWSDDALYNPWIQIWYFMAVEFFGAKSDNSIDITNMIASELGTEFYIGAVGRGETSAPVAGWLRNMSGEIIPLLEVYDDHPEWSDPVADSGNNGSGKLNYVVLAESSLSQQYTVIFTGTNDYEVIAEAYADYPTSLHPTQDADPNWTGNIGSDWTAPSGGLTIPARAFVGSFIAGDQFTFVVIGNTSETDWPSDSALQTYIARDNAGAPDTTTWRRADGRHETTIGPVTIDTATKKIPIRAHSSSKWVVGSPAFIGTQAGIHEGTVKSAGEASASAPTFTGSGLDDLSRTDKYYGPFIGTIRIEIDGNGTPDTFKWSKDGGSTWEATGQALVAGSGNAINLIDGLFVYWGATTGHTIGDYWEIDVQPYYVEIEGLTADSTTYDAGARVGTSLPITNFPPVDWAQATSDFGNSSVQPDQIPLSTNDVSKFQSGDTIFVQDIENGDRSEEATISSVGPNYLDLASPLVYDYSSGAVVSVIDSGNVRFWMQIRATGTTTLEQKKIRLNARL